MVPQALFQLYLQDIFFSGRALRSIQSSCFTSLLQVAASRRFLSSCSVNREAPTFGCSFGWPSFFPVVRCFHRNLFLPPFPLAPPVRQSFPLSSWSLSPALLILFRPFFALDRNVFETWTFLFFNFFRVTAPSFGTTSWGCFF